MATRLFKITAIALLAGLSACAASVPSPLRVAAAQSPSLPLYGSTVRPSLDCSDDDGGFDAPDAMKLSPEVFRGCRAQ
jgi:hypothetical protein